MIDPIAFSDALLVTAFFNLFWAVIFGLVYPWINPKSYLLFSTSKKPKTRFFFGVIALVTVCNALWLCLSYILLKVLDFSFIINF